MVRIESDGIETSSKTMSFPTFKIKKQKTNKNILSE